MNKIATISAIFLISTALLAPLDGFAQGGISISEGQIEASRGFLAQIKALFASAEDTANQTQEASQDIQTRVEQSGLKGVLSKIWSGITDFFADKSMRDLVVDTLKLGLRVVANIFIIIANVIQRILAAV